MSEVNILYLRALSDYMRNGRDFANPPADGGLAALLACSSAADIVQLHQECTQRLTMGMNPEEALDRYRMSFGFLAALMARFQNHLYAAPASLLLLKNKYENVLQHLDSGIVLFNESGRLTFLNVKMAELLRVPRKTLVGFDFISILRNRRIPHRVRKSMLRLYREMIEYRMPFYEVITEQGRHLLITATYGDDLDGDLLVSVKDVTEYKRIEQAAYQNDKLAILGRISAGIAHEIRNPLTSIRGFIQFLKQDLTALGKEEYASIILAEIDRANQIIYEFLNSSKPSAPIKENIGVQPLLKEVLFLLESEALMNSCRIDMESIDPGLTIHADIRQLKQVLLNVIKNAVEAVTHHRDGEEGRVSISAKREGNSVCVAVADNGKGMDPHTAARLFDPFFTTKDEGTGLGLAVSYRIIKNHGGKIDVKSEAGQGTTFVISLPLG